MSLQEGCDGLSHGLMRIILETLPHFCHTANTIQGGDYINPLELL